MFWRQCRFRIIRMVCILILIYIMLTRRRSYKRYVHKGGTKTKRNDIIDTSELEKPKVFSIQDVHNLFFKNKEESKTEYKDENQDKIDEYVAKSMTNNEDETEEQPISEENQLNLEKLAIKSDSEEEEEEEEEEDENADSIENLRNIVADALSEEALATAKKELKDESGEKQRQKNAKFFHKVFVPSTKEEDIMNRAYVSRGMKSLSDAELVDRYITSENILGSFIYNFLEEQQDSFIEIIGNKGKIKYYTLSSKVQLVTSKTLSKNFPKNRQHIFDNQMNEFLKGNISNFASKDQLVSLQKFNDKFI